MRHDGRPYPKAERDGSNEGGGISAPPKRKALVKLKSAWFRKKTNAWFVCSAWSGIGALRWAADSASALVTPLRGVRHTGQRKSLRVVSASSHVGHRPWPQPKGKASWSLVKTS